MKIKFKFARRIEVTPFSGGDFLILPSPFFKYMKFGKYRAFRIGFLFLQSELSITIRNEIKLTKQTTDQGRIS